MPTTKLVTFYSKHERENYHRAGYWIDRNGFLLPVKDMSYERLEKLVRMLAGWAAKEDNPIGYLRNQPILPHVYQRIVHFKMSNFHTEMLKSAMADKLVSKKSVNPDKENWMYCLTHECWGVVGLASSMNGCVYVSCPPPEMEENWQDNVSDPHRSELEMMDIFAQELVTSWA